jgi:DNA-binding NarL/FixJ family response regulator
MSAIRVLLVEDDSFTRTTMEHSLTAANIEVIAGVSTATEAIACVKAHEVDVAIIDLDLGPGANGIDIAHALREENSNIGIIILTSYSDPRFADSQALPKGGIFLTKSQLPSFETLLAAIVQAHEEPLANKVRSTPKVGELSKTQIEVLRLIAGGFSSIEVANRQGVTVKAVEATITKLHSVLGLERSKLHNSRVQLTRAFFTLTGKTPPNVD